MDRPSVDNGGKSGSQSVPKFSAEEETVILKRIILARLLMADPKAAMKYLDENSKDFPEMEGVKGAKIDTTDA